MTKWVLHCPSFPLFLENGGTVTGFDNCHIPLLHSLLQQNTTNAQIRNSETTSEGGINVILRCATQFHNFPQWFMYCVRRLRSKPSPWVRMSAGARDILFFKAFRPIALRPTQPPIQWEWGVLSPGKSDKGVMSTTDLYLTSRLQNEWSYASTPPTFRGWAERNTPC